MFYTDCVCIKLWFSSKLQDQDTLVSLNLIVLLIIPSGLVKGIHTCLQHFILAEIQTPKSFSRLTSDLTPFHVVGTVSLAVTYMYNLTLTYVKFHLPFLCPRKQFIKISLQLATICTISNFPEYLSIIGELQDVAAGRLFCYGWRTIT